jgi:hypothetical protein
MTGRPELEITPEPSPDERAAIEAAVAEVLNGESETRGAWWRAGVLDAADDDEPDGS